MKTTNKIVQLIVSAVFLVLAVACGVQDPNAEESNDGYVPECSQSNPCGEGYSCHHGSCEADEQEDVGPEYPGCNSRSDCRIGEHCIEGQCGVPNAAIICERNYECPDGYVCDNGACKQFLVDEAKPQCEVDEDCRDGFVCDAGECKTAPFTPAEEPDPECEHDNDCAADEVCVHGACHPEPEEPVVDEPECRTDADCGADQICTDGVCCDAPEEPEVTEPEEPQYLPDPFRSPRACVMDFSSYYLAGATMGEIRGNLPNNTWENGYVIADPNVQDDYAYMGITWADPPEAGTYELSYTGYHGDVEPASDAWALYGKIGDVERMRPEAVAFLECNWWDEQNERIVDVSGPHCKIRIKIDSACNIRPAGNMANFLD